MAGGGGVNGGGSVGGGGVGGGMNGAMAGGMSFNTCHNTHVDRQGQLAAYSITCMRCHTAGGDHFCKRKPAMGEDITKNCIDCHMPVKASNLVTLMVPGQKQLAPLLVRSHLIAIYTKK